MTDLPDPDWCIENVLAFAEPGRVGPVRPTEVDLWQQWWTSRAAEVRTRWPEMAEAAAGFVITSATARTAGASRHLVAARVRRGLWSAPDRGAVALIGPTTLTDGRDRWLTERRVHALDAAAAVVLNPGHATSGRSAAVLAGLPTVSLPARPELTTAKGASVRRRHARIAGLPQGDVGNWFGIPVTTTARTVVDVARHSRSEGVVVADAALRCRLTTRTELRQAVADAIGWPGVRDAREIVEFADPLAESPLESLTRLAIADAGLPPPQLQVPFEVPGRRRPYVVDMLWPEQRLVLECDGRLKYRDPNDLWREKTRDTALRRLDLDVEHVAWDDVTVRWALAEARLRELLT